MKTLKKWGVLGICVTVLLSLALGALPVSAGATGTVTYSMDGKISYSPDVYTVDKVLYGKDVGADAFIQPIDMRIDQAGNLYVLDQGAKAVIIIDKVTGQSKTVKEFTENGVKTDLYKPSGLYVDNLGRLYICDYGNQRVVRCNTDGVIDLVLTRPDSVAFPATVEFYPEKVIVDSAYSVYVSCTGVSQGLVSFSEEGKFEGFFGAPSVATTAELLSDYFWKQLMTDAQKEEMASYVPDEIANMCITDDDFIFTISNAFFSGLDQKKREMDSLYLLNPKGEDILRFDTTKQPGKTISKDAQYLNFTAAYIDDAGLLTLADNLRGKIYQFDENMNLIGAFGGPGNYDGAFMSPVSIVAFDENLYVLDSENASITVFALTKYGRKIHNALEIYGTAKQSEAIGPWQEVIKYNANYDLAYIGIGNVLLNRGDYQEAMKYFELGHDSVQYNKAFREYRTLFLRENMLYIVLALAAVIILWKVATKKIIPAVREKVAQKGRG